MRSLALLLVGGVAAVPAVIGLATAADLVRPGLVAPAVLGVALAAVAFGVALEPYRDDGPRGWLRRLARRFEPTQQKSNQEK